MRRAIPVLLALLGLLVYPAQAQPTPEVISFQGRLTQSDGQPVADGSYQLQFHLYDQPNGGTLQWTETQTVTTRGGVFTAMLGSVTSLSGLSFEDGYYVALGVNGSADLGPRTALTAVPYALSAQRLDASALEAGSNVTITRQGDGALRIEAAGGGSGGGLSRVSTDATLTGEGTSASPLRLSDEAVVAGQNVTVSRENDGSFVVSATGGGGGGLSQVATDATLEGDGTAGSPLSLADGSVTGAKLSDTALQAGSDVTITRQGDGSLEIAATASPFSLPYVGSVNSNQPALDIENTGMGAAIRVQGTLIGLSVENTSFGINVINAIQNGLDVGTAGQFGVSVGHAGRDGVFVDTASRDGVFIDSAGRYGLNVVNAARGVDISNTSDDGILVRNAGGHGLRILNTTSKGIQIDQAGDNGIQIDQADLNGVRIVQAAVDGVLINAARFGLNVVDATRGVDISNTSDDGILVRNAGGHGLRILDATSTSSDGVHIESAGRDGLHVEQATASGLYVDQVKHGVYLNSTTNDGIVVRDAGQHGLRIQAATTNGIQIDQAGTDGILVQAAGRYGIKASGTTAAGYFDGDVTVTGILSKGGGSFKIDHPLDPAGKYLSHSFVESPDMMNVYNGNVTTDAQGFATVTLPSYFEVLNRDFRYQLTAIGTFAQAIVAEKVIGNRFVIQTDRPGVEVSWQATGIRQDAWANDNRIVVEQAKPAEERGYYLHPAVFGQPRERGLTARTTAQQQ